jgi:hypothetical protein
MKRYNTLYPIISVILQMDSNHFVSYNVNLVSKMAFHLLIYQEMDLKLERISQVLNLKLNVHSIPEITIIGFILDIYLWPEFTSIELYRLKQIYTYSQHFYQKKAKNSFSLHLNKFQLKEIIIDFLLHWKKVWNKRFKFEKIWIKRLEFQ